MAVFGGGCGPGSSCWEWVMSGVQESAKCHTARVALIYRGIIDNLSDHLPSLLRKAKGKWTNASHQMPDIDSYLQQMGFFLLLCIVALSHKEICKNKAH